MSEDTLEFRYPATRWQEALPVGNGMHGALLFGNRARETILLNHESLWLPVLDPDRVRRPISHLLPKVRERILAGKPDEADTLWQDEAKKAGYPFVYSDPCHPGGEVIFEAQAGGDFSDYRRIVDCGRGIAGTSWKDGSNHFVRQVFASRTEDIIVIRFSASRKGALSGKLSLQNVDHLSARIWAVDTFDVKDLIFFKGTAGGEYLSLEGHYKWGGGYGIAARVRITGGASRKAGNALAVLDADEVVVLVKIISGRSPASCVRKAKAALAAVDKAYATLKRDHVTAHRELFERTRLQLGGGAETVASAEQQLLDAYSGQVPVSLIRNLWNFGRYLFISSSHAMGRFPPHLQGIWTGTWHPPWFGNFTLDENIQMCHWQALPGMLGELMKPFIGYIFQSLPDWRINAREIFGCKGILAPLMQSNRSGRFDAAEWHFWISGAGWIAQHLWDYWLYTRDGKFLRTRLVPFLVEVVEFYEDYLVEGVNGQLRFVPSLSVENKPEGWPSRSAINATMDVAVAREVLGSLCEARDHLRLDGKETDRLKRLMDRLPPYVINGEGALAEWIHPLCKDQYHHRHQSHLYPLFPGSEITRQRTPALFNAARKAVDKRKITGLSSQTGWSFAHMAHIYARLGEGEDALRCLESIIRSCTQSNLLMCHNDWRGMGLTMGGVAIEGKFQIDANMGFASAVQEMLLSSSSDSVTVLPALPESWYKGSLKGIDTRCGVVVNLTWNRSRDSVTAELHARYKTSLMVLPGKGLKGEPRRITLSGKPLKAIFAFA